MALWVCVGMEDREGEGLDAQIEKFAEKVLDEWRSLRVMVL